MPTNRPIAVTASALTSDAREAPALARRAGFDGLVLDAYGPHLSLPELSTSGRRELRRILAGERQQLVAIQCDLGPRGFGPGSDVRSGPLRLHLHRDDRCAPVRGFDVHVHGCRHAPL